MVSYGKSAMNSFGIRPHSKRSSNRAKDTSLEAFQKFELGRRTVFLRRDLMPRAAEIITSLSGIGSAPGIGNRSSGFLIKLKDGTELFVRLGRRGGLIRWLTKDVYVGVRPRPLRELAVAVAARRLGIPVAEPMGAIIEWIAPLIYRGMFLTRALPGMTLWEFLRTDDDPVVRAHVIEQVRKTIATMHRHGLLHADLNLHNLFVSTAHESFAIAILDLDKARFFPGPLSQRLRTHNLARLRRSALKLDSRKHFLDSRALDLLTTE